MRVLDLFSGIGGFSIGLERAGMKTVAFCEIDPFRRKVLAKHWPKVPCFEDIRTLKGSDVGTVDLICGGFPCQDISLAGRGAGLGGSRSGLWSEYRRVVEEKDPDWVVIENVSALRSRGLDTVLREIAALGYDAEWHCIPAAAVGAPHRRDRVWIVAHAARLQPGRQEQRPIGERSGSRGEPVTVADANAFGAHGCGPRGAEGDQSQDRGADVADTSGPRLPLGELLAGVSRGAGQADQGQDAAMGGANWWLTEPDVGRVAHGIPARVDRLRSLGNAVVPQIPEIIGRAIMSAVGYPTHP